MSWQSAKSYVSEWRLLAIPFMLVFLGLVTAGFYASYVENTVTLPLRVYAPNGTDAHVESVTLQVNDASGVDRLYVQAHQPFYHRGGVEQGVEEGFDPEGAAAIRVNGGPWIEVRDENVECAFPESEYGCVAGTYSTIRFAVPVSSVQSGPNTVEFKFNGTEGVRSGYRVLKLGLMRPGDDLQRFDPLADGASETEFRKEDYAEWEAPEGYGMPRDAQAGKELFQSKGILVNDALSGEAIQAACSSCHARDGRDLKYFNYSNRSIVARSRYHGLSEDEGKQIAAYIRSIELEKKSGETYEAPGTPWDPPYQPGPEGFGPEGEQGPDEANQVYWAAGAGLNAVLDRDEEMLPYLFPDGNGGVDRLPGGDLDWRHLSADSTLNTRAMPLAIQFPDWNNWLPDIHPMDAVPSRFDGGKAQARYEGELRNALEAGDLGDIDREIKRFHIAWRDNGLKHFDQPAGMTQNEWVTARMGAEQWKAVKVWESFHMYHLENVADEMYGDSDVAPYNEPRGWMGRNRTLFDLGPHISGTNGVRERPFVYANGNQEQFMTHLWYHLQAIINPGSSPSSSSQKPLDWNYQRSFIAATAGYDVGASLRMLQSEVKKWQQLSNGYGVDGTGGEGFDNFIKLAKGWSPFTTNPMRLMDMTASSGIYKNLSHQRRSDVLEAALRAWWDYNGRFPVSEFPRNDGNRGYDPPSDTQVGSGFNPSSRDLDERLYRAIPRVRDRLNVSPGILDSISTWGGKMWPHTTDPSWEELIDDDASDNQAPAARFANLSDGNTFTASANLTIEVDAYDADGGVRRVAVFADSTKLGEDTSAPYRVSWEDVPAGTYTLTARAVDEEGRSGSSAPVEITVEGRTETTQRIVLEKGWNFISSRVRPQAARLDSVFANTPELAVVRNGEGQTYTPGHSDNDLTEWSVQASYLAFMHARDTLRVRGQAAACETPLSLQEGWNFIPYLCGQPQPPEAAFAAIADKLVRVKDERGNEYLPAKDLDGIGMLQPGQGYEVYVSSKVTLTYPAPQQQSVSTKKQRGEASSTRLR
jgi:cytochrome c553